MYTFVAGYFTGHNVCEIVTLFLSQIPQSQTNNSISKEIPT